MSQASAALQSIPERVGARPAIVHSENRTFQNHSSSRESSCEEISMTDRNNIAGKLSGSASGNFSAETGRARAFHLTQKQWRLLSSGAFRAYVGTRPGGAKVISDELECSAKTAQSWLDAESTPAGILDLRAMSRIPEYAALKREVADLEAKMDPRLQRKLQELHTLTLEIADGKGLRV